MKSESLNLKSYYFESNFQTNYKIPRGSFSDRKIIRLRAEKPHFQRLNLKPKGRFLCPRVKSSLYEQVIFQSFSLIIHQTEKTRPLKTMIETMT